VSQVTGFATADLNGEGNAFLQLFGVDPQAYLEMFPDTVEVLEGRFLESNETGIVISEDVAQMLEESSGREVEIGDTILLTNMNSVSGTKIREIEIMGIFCFVANAANLDLISYIDVDSLRALSGMTKVIDIEADLSQAEQEVLGSVEEEDLFGGGDELFAETELAIRESNEESLLSILGDTSEAQALRELDPDAWQYVLLEVEDNVSAQRLIRSLNSSFEELGLDVKAYGWEEAAGPTAQLVSGLKTVFNALIIVVAVVAIIIIMNTLVISITERIGEIGTMRAVGARRSFVRRMITLETLMISLVFGLIGIVLGSGLIGILNLTGIEASSMFLQVLFGGSVLTPVVSLGSVLTSLLMVIIVGIVASLYPVSVALKIEPVRAMNQR
jgi:putative ABC transport system permease protein